MQAQQSLIRIEIPSTIVEITVIGLTDPEIQQEAQKMIADKGLDPTTDVSSITSQELQKIPT